MKTQNKSRRYNNLDGLRMFAAIGIICMHIRGNGDFKIPSVGISNYLINTFIGHMGILVQLFFIISGFSMCCGYYERIKNNQISLNDFYKRRYERILPFFALLVLIDLFSGLIFYGGISSDSLYEAFADLTLMFGFYTTSGMNVIGVGWALGIIFGFYILFPFFVFLIWDKKRAWFSLFITCMIYIVCCVYFHTLPNLTFPWICYFAAGGLIYLYRDSISLLVMKGKWLGPAVFVLGLIIALVIPYSGSGAAGAAVDLLIQLAGYSMMVCGTLCADNGFFYNPVSKYISKISLEIYLAHMLFFRIMEKLHLTTIGGGGVLSYIITCIGTIAGAMIFSSVYHYLEERVRNRFIKA